MRLLLSSVIFRAGATLAIFTMTGPLIGWVVTAILLWPLGFPNLRGFPLQSWGLPLAYLFGSIPAFLAGGLVFLSRERLIPKFDLSAPSIGMVIGPLYLVVALFILFGEDNAGFVLFGMVFGVLALLQCIVATCLCAVMTRWVDPSAPLA